VLNPSLVLCNGSLCYGEYLFLLSINLVSPLPPSLCGKNFRGTLPPYLPGKTLCKNLLLLFFPFSPIHFPRIVSMTSLDRRFSHFPTVLLRQQVPALTLFSRVFLPLWSPPRSVGICWDLHHDTPSRFHYRCSFLGVVRPILPEAMICLIRAFIPLPYTPSLLLFAPAGESVRA